MTNTTGRITITIIIIIINTRTILPRTTLHKQITRTKLCIKLAS